jgi:hypothetical protein
MSATEQFDTALAGLVNRERGSVYGHPLDNFRRIAALQATTAECRDPEIRVALDNICVKLARLIETPSHIDSAIDVAGYARTIVMILDKRAG